jgi:hypothetical protein
MQIQLCDLNNCSQDEHTQCGNDVQWAQTLRRHMHGLCNEPMCNCLTTLARLCCN